MGEARLDIKGLATYVLIGASLTGAATATAGDGAAPRYALSPGREFSFHNEARSDSKNNPTVYIVDWKVWAISRDPDGAWRVVIRCDLRRASVKSQKQSSKDPVDTIVWRCRMFDDGRLVGADTMGTVRDLFRLFPRLPANATESDRGWESEGVSKAAVKLHHRLTPGTKSDGETVSITTRAEGPQNKVYVLTQEYCATFDRRRGVVSRVETKDTSGYPNSSTTLGTIELTGTENRGEAWAATFGREADRYFDAIEAYDAACERSGTDAARCDQILADAKSKLAETRKGLTTPVFKDGIEQKLARHDRLANSYVAQAKDQAARLGKAAAEWEAKGLDGKNHRLADYRGKVVVMDFWYRGCGWCMYAMPQVVKISKTFRDQPVVVLGMTTDEKDDDARVVVDAMGIDYPTIKASGIPPKYGVEGYPTLIVIDQAGKIRKIHVGYSPRLFEEVSGVIRELLAEESAVRR
jgi:thiol-disulfide isomerase/thioredoxin